MDQKNRDSDLDEEIKRALGGEKLRPRPGQAGHASAGNQGVAIAGDRNHVYIYGTGFKAEKKPRMGFVRMTAGVGMLFFSGWLVVAHAPLWAETKGLEPILSRIWQFLILSGQSGPASLVAPILISMGIGAAVASLMIFKRR